VLITSSEPKTLQRVQELDPAFETGYSVRTERGRPTVGVDRVMTDRPETLARAC
jgi:hypothetical protein